MKITSIKAIYPDYQHVPPSWRTHLWQIWDISGGSAPHFRQISINHLKEGDFVFYASKGFCSALLNKKYEIV